MPEDVKLGPFPKGMDNRAQDHDLPGGTCRNAVNMMFPVSGRARRRPGLTKTVSLVNGEDGYSCPNGTYFVEGSDIKKLEDDDSKTTLESGVVFGTTFTWEYFDDIVYFSDGLITRKIHSDDTITDWGMENPGDFVLSKVAGSLNAGTYNAVVTFVDSNGVESGSSDIISLVAESSTGVKFVNLPTTSDPQVAALRLYMTMPDGKTFFYLGQVSLGTTIYSVTSKGYDDARHLKTLLVAKPPACRIIRYFRGRLYCATASGNVYFTDEFKLDHVTPSKNGLKFPNQLNIMQPVEDGIYFADDYVTDFFAGTNPYEFNRVRIFDYGGVYDTGERISDSQVCWWSKEGPIKAGNTGQAVNISEDVLAPEIAASGAMLIREQDGIKQFIASLHDTTTSKLACSDFIDAEVIRRGS